MVTKEDIKRRGYDLTADGRLNIGDFNTIDDAVNEFIESCCNMIWSLIEKHRGVEWTEAFKSDMARTDLTDNALLIQNGLKKALIEQVIFIYENGDVSANAIKDDGKRSLSPKAVTKLYNIGIIKF